MLVGDTTVVIGLVSSEPGPVGSSVHKPPACGRMGTEPFGFCVLRK